MNDKSPITIEQNPVESTTTSDAVRKEIWDRHSNRGSIALMFIKSIAANRGVRANHKDEADIISYSFTLADEIQKAGNLEYPNRGTIALEIIIELLKKQGMKSSAKFILKHSLNLADRMQKEINITYEKEISDLDKTDE